MTPLDPGAEARRFLDRYFAGRHPEFDAERLAALTSLLSRAVEGSGIVPQDEFDARMSVLSEALPLVKSLLSAGLPFEGWSDILKRDAYLKMGLEPVTMYRVVDTVEPHRKKSPSPAPPSEGKGAK